ncbi:MAG: ester cyclase [Legionellales bacterium]|nr:ester cyclase [Legionellales bacterium]|tara:strand:+ start:11986 stop:12390 length:405 start_codon:yes stop_codon:yes gene_type:complete
MKNIDIIKDYQSAIWADKDITAIDRAFANDAVIHSPVESMQSLLELKSAISQWYAGFPDLVVHWDDHIVDGDKVVSRWTAKGKHDGEFMGIAPTHRDVYYTGATFYELQDGKIIHYWAFVDMECIKRQISDVNG